MKQFFIINKYSLIIFFLFISFSSLAAPPGGGPPPPNGGGGPGTVNDVPINMYWFILLVTGAYYGVEKLR